MARKGAEYSDEQLAEMYRRYAELKGWSTRNEVIREKIQAWRDSSIGPVGLAIDFHKTGKDNAKHLGHNAETESSQKQGNIKKGCFRVFAAVAAFLLFAVVVITVGAVSAYLFR